MSYYAATVMFVVGLISLVVLLPVANELLPGITNTMGGTVGIMLGSMILILIASAIVMYVQMSQADDNYLPPGAYDY
jgi:hypothetical protein